MTSDTRRTYQIAAQLREAFDRSFSLAPRAGITAHDDFLAVRIAGDPYAFRLSEVAALHRDRKVVPIVSQVPELLGVAAFRGMMAPIYDLAALLGYQGTASARWLILARGAVPVGLAFDAVDGHRRAASDSVSSSEGDHGPRHVRGALHLPEAIRPLIHIASVVLAIAQRVHPDNPRKEH